MNCFWSEFTPQHYLYCERQLCGWLQQPANTWSNVGYLIASLFILRSKKTVERQFFFWSTFSLFIGSTLFHMSGSHLGKILDVGAMLALSMGICALARKLKPKSEDDLLRYTYWLHYAEGSAITPFLFKLIFDKIETSPMPFFVRPIARKISEAVKSGWINSQIKLHLDYLEDEIGKTGWFAGNEFSAADIMMSYPLEAAASDPKGLGRKNLIAFHEKLLSRPAYRRAIERGGPFSVMPVSSRNV